MEDNTVQDAWLDILKVRKDDIAKLLKDARPREVPARTGTSTSKPTIENKLGINANDWDRAIDAVMDGLMLIEAQVLIAKQKTLAKRD